MDLYPYSYKYLKMNLKLKQYCQRAFPTVKEMVTGYVELPANSVERPFWVVMSEQFQEPKVYKYHNSNINRIKLQKEYDTKFFVPRINEGRSIRYFSDEKLAIPRLDESEVQAMLQQLSAKEDSPEIKDKAIFLSNLLKNSRK
ncbi:hypothetical protein PPL_00314 [Heterostelium album PN500]|uniref:Uncharacterized protein n=1 Tax=Heterostelium pallidum (strain ATCC 26659 / Pp 5 / PN500) TaxID=670386 RepID=D3AW46_HETP5|nr:hypothetical protein PPL_00314 [Heterostelium album PN500]EFA86519.1 hypothetical protein PPL_00314 [Heterostelium album PN500]|eukprot:XP_020438624.1 hypothetical protein PPL_00314 [Heterostelium album PN500]